MKTRLKFFARNTKIGLSMTVKGLYGVMKLKLIAFSSMVRNTTSKQVKTFKQFAAAIDKPVSE